jgi:hypothetical protein
MAVWLLGRCVDWGVRVRKRDNVLKGSYQHPEVSGTSDVGRFNTDWGLLGLKMAWTCGWGTGIDRGCWSDLRWGNSLAVRGVLVGGEVLMVLMRLQQGLESVGVKER